MEQKMIKSTVTGYQQKQMLI